MNLSEIRRECIRVGTLLRKHETPLRARVADIQTKAEALTHDATSDKLDPLATDLKALAVEVDALDLGRA